MVAPLLAVAEPRLITNSIFTENSAGGGGSIYNSSTLTITNTTFSDNSALTSSGGAIINSGALLAVTNSTFSGNSAATIGGGIYSTSPLTVTNSTLSGNTAITSGGGIYNNFGILHLQNTILANSLNGGDCYNNSGDTIATNTNNLIETNGVSGHMCGTPALTADPMLGSLTNNGGPTQTFALLAGSPAIDAGDDASCPVIDQRNVARPQGSHCDIGLMNMMDLSFLLQLTHQPSQLHLPPLPQLLLQPILLLQQKQIHPPQLLASSYNPLYLSLTGNQTIGGVASADEDILRFDGSAWSLFFDGSDVGVGGSDLFGFSILDSDSILMSFSSAVTVNGLAVTPQDVVRFDATSLGSTTAGTFSMYLDGSDVGLDTTAEKIDSVSLLPDGRVLISTTGNPAVAV